MHDLDLTTLRLFVATCDHRNIGRAAAQNHIGTSAISKRLAQLEDQVRAPLLERHRRGVVPTAAGEMLLEHARAMLATADRVARDMTAYRKGVKGQVRVLASVSAITESLPDDIASFLQMPEHAQIRVDIEERTSSELVSALREGLAPIGVCWDAADLEGLATRPYRGDELCVVVHPSHPLARRKSCSFEQTLDFDHVGLPANTAVHTMLARAAAIIGKPIYYRAVVSTFDASLRCVRAGLGLAVVPREIASTSGEQDRRRIVRLDDAWAQRRFAICFRDPGHLSPAARLLVDHLSAQAPKGQRLKPSGPAANA
ncbi:LysR family transcriptional regulator [Variovorax dokdonensis]|uniref:LysR family transcriptional regulator n=1 Tax=Variovorax dokdonensis TaxID=344883 RepID=A0ABT7N9F9_9BURK|nr:LysR family transcriptional regulator [Variovorax dokdonensis]MDM0044495.1 LysR family transcriptional regulator [Variovorax dokdonensis]